MGKLKFKQVAGAAASGANADITSLAGLTTALSVPQGGLGNTTGDASGLSVTATGGTSVQTNAKRAATHLTVEDFGAKGDGVTDDTAAFNAYAAFLRALTGYKGYCAEFSLAHGACYRLTGSVNLTALPFLIFDGHGSTIVGSVVGYPVLDAVQSPQQTFQNFTLIGAGSSTNIPLCGLQIGRALNGLSGSQSTALHNVFFDGTFSRTAIYNRACETSLFNNVFATNRFNSATGYALIMDGSAYWPIVSQFAATYNPSAPAVADALYGTSPNVSFNENTIIGGSFISYYAPAIWMSNFRGHEYNNPYLAGYYASLMGPGQGPAAIVYFGLAEAPAQLKWKVHSEGGISSDLQFAGAQSSPTLAGLLYENHVDSTFGCALSLGSGVTSATVRDARISIAAFFKPTATVFDSGSAWTVSGSASVPLANWNGTINGLLDTGSGWTFSGALGNVSAGTLTASALNANSLGNPSSVSAVSVATPTQGVSLWTSSALAGALPLITITAANGSGAGATAAYQNIVVNSPPSISGGVGVAVGDSFYLDDPQSGGGIYGGGRAYYVVTSVSGGAVTGTSWNQTANNAYLWAKPMSASTALSVKSSACTTLPTVALSNGYPAAIWSITNNNGGLKSTLTFTGGSGYTVVPSYALTPVPGSPVTGGAALSITLSASLTVGAGGGQIAFGSFGTKLGTVGSTGLPVVSQGASIDGSGVRTALTTSGYTVPANTSLVRFTQTGTIASATVTLPTALGDGQPIQFVNQGAGAITALTFSPAVQGWTNGAQLSGGPGVSLRIRWDATAAAWYRE